MTSPTDKNLDQTAGKGVKDIEVLETDQDIAITETSLQYKVSSSKQDSSQVTPTESFENDLGVDNGSEDEDGSDADSALGSSMGDSESTISVESSVYNFVVENGHTYHSYKDGKYHFPNDETEKDRLDLQHHLWLLTLRGRHHLAPLQTLGSVSNVLDIGTGTGIWAIDFANRYPSAIVTGTDLSPIQPEYIPPNCHFEIDDAEDEWLYTKKFDFIHCREMHTCFSNYSAIIKNAFDHLQPGGYLEIQDVSGPPKAIDDSSQGTNLEYWIHLLHQGSIKLGANWKLRNWAYRKFFEEAGFVDIVETHYQWPSNPWPKGRHNKILGKWYNESLTSGLHGLSVALLIRGLEMSAEEVELLLVGVRKDLGNKDIHMYNPITVIYGKKPE